MIKKLIIVLCILVPGLKASELNETDLALRKTYIDNVRREGFKEETGDKGYDIRPVRLKIFNGSLNERIESAERMFTYYRDFIYEEIMVLLKNIQENFSSYSKDTYIETVRDEVDDLVNSMLNELVVHSIPYADINPCAYLIMESSGCAHIEELE